MLFYKIRNKNLDRKIYGLLNIQLLFRHIDFKKIGYFMVAEQ